MQTGPGKFLNLFLSSLLVTPVL